MTVEDTAGETPATDETSGVDKIDGQAGETPDNKSDEKSKAKPDDGDKPDDGVDKPEDKPDGSEAERLREALRKERELRKAAERARDKTTRTEAERIADMERELQQMRAERMRDNVLDRLASELAGQGYEFNRSDVLELLEDVPLTEENAENAVARRVEKLKRKSAVKTPDTATRAMTDGKSEVGLNNPYAGFKS